MHERPTYYILNADGDPIAAELRTWALWFEDAARRRVALDTLPEGRLVSTVFLGLDHNWGAGPPLLFETRVFVDGESVECACYATRAEALAGHARAVAAAAPVPPRVPRGV